MTKAEVIRMVMEKTGLPRKDAIEAVEVFLQSVKDGLQSSQKVSLVGFGTFFVKEKDSRNGRNPRTGELIRIPPKKVAVFKPGKPLREVIKSSTEKADSKS
ncbi:MAG: HU family DNA-binding protein [Candidatus Sumerlaeia bacterium]|nr:HU family DNA-binding protein [Candidatus Sumerlaeia bacterium]